MRDKQTFTDHVVTDTDLQRNCMGGGQLVYIKQTLCVFTVWLSEDEAEGMNIVVVFKLEQTNQRFR